MKKGRLSGIELLRIISMVMIVAHHYALHTPWGDGLVGGKAYLINILTSFGKVGVAIFFMITGYFLANRRKFSIKKVWGILLPTWFYSLGIFGVMALLHLFGAQLSWPPNHVALGSIFPLLSDGYWFITQYVVIFLLSPILKKGLDSLNDRDLLKLGVLLFGVSTGARFLKVILGIGASGIFFIPDGLYFVIFGYIVFRLKAYISQKQAVFAVSAGTAILLLGHFALKLMWSHGINAPVDFFWSANSISPLLIAGGLVILCASLKFSSRIINYIAGLSLGVYLIHDNFLCRQALWGADGIAHNLDYLPQSFINFFIHSILVITLVYIGCAIIEAIRKTLFKFCSKCYNYFMPNIRNMLTTFWHDKAAKQRLLLYFLAVMVFFGAFLKPDFATDTYAYAMGDFSDIVGNFLRCGRVFTAGIYTLLRLAHINICYVNIACFIIAAVSLTFALYILEKLLRRNFIPNQLWSFLLPFLILVNPFIIEYFLFIEKGIMCFCILLCVVSAYFYNDYLNRRRRSDLLKVLFLNIFATFWYQGVIGLFIVLVTLITVMKAKQLVPFIKDTLLSVGLYIIGPLVNMLVVKLFFADGRTSGGLNPIEALKATFGGVRNMFEVFGIIPTYIFWGYLIVIVIIWAYHAVRRRKLKAIYLGQVLYLSLVIFLAAIAPQMALQPSSVWIAPRAVYAFATIIGSILTIIIYATPELVVTKPEKSIIVTMTIGFMFVQFLGFNNIILDHYSLAEIDRLRAEKIGQEIASYERANDIEIKYIATSGDQNASYSYTGIKTVADSNISAFSTDWSDVTNLNFWNGRKFVRIQPSSEWQQYCSGHDWQNFDTTQLKFSGDKLEICLY